MKNMLSTKYFSIKITSKYGSRKLYSEILISKHTYTTYIYFRANTNLTTYFSSRMHFIKITF